MRTFLQKKSTATCILFINLKGSLMVIEKTFAIVMQPMAPIYNILLTITTCT